MGCFDLCILIPPEVFQLAEDVNEEGKRLEGSRSK